MEDLFTLDDEIEASETCSLGSEDKSHIEEHELPSMEDRKLFLTCLAAILTSSYKYDVMEDDGDTATTTQQQQILEEEEEADDCNQNDSEHPENNNNTQPENTKPSNETETTPTKQTQKQQKMTSMETLSSDEELDNAQEAAMRVDAAVTSSMRSANDVSMFLEEEEEDEVAVKKSKPKPTAQNNNNNSNNNTGPARRRWRRWGRGRNNNIQDTSMDSSHNVEDEEDDDDQSTHSNTSSNSNTNSIRQQQEQKQRRKRISKAQQKLQLAATRHYRRRYIIADQFLQASCDHLLLDKEISQQIYDETKPRLEALKTPRVVPAGSNLMVVSRRMSSKRWSSNVGSGDGSGGSDGSDDNGSDQDDAPEDVANAQEITAVDPRQKQMQQQYLKQHEWMTEYDPELLQHLPKLSPGAGYRCLCWLLFQHLLHATKRGYDARVRYAFKSLAVAVLIQDIERTLEYSGDHLMEWKIKNYTTWVSFATRKFEQIETAMAERLLKLANDAQQQQQDGEDNVIHVVDDSFETAPAQEVSLDDIEELGAGDEVQVVTVKKNKKKLSGAKKHLVRGLKIGGVGVVAGTLLAVTGGMAAPAIAGALTFLGMGAVAGTFMSLASTTAVVHIFGVAGGSLAAYKMRRRTAGLTEFTIVQSTSTTAKQDDTSESSQPDLLPQEKEQAKAQQPRIARWRDKAKAFKNRNSNNGNNSNNNNQQGEVDPTALPAKPELSRTICISGWLTDKQDFQRPWGISPTKPPASKLEKLQRFYRVYNPDLIPVCSNLLKRWKKEESTFWELLEDKYGCNPDTLFPLRFGPRYDASLTEMEVLVLDKLIVEIGKARGEEKKARHAHLPDHVQNFIATPSQKDRANGLVDHADDGSVLALDDKSIVSVVSEEMSAAAEEKEEAPSPGHFQRQCYASVFEQVAPSSSLENLIPPAHLATVWDFSSRYGGEVYSLHWETHMLMKLSQCFKEVALTTAASAGQQALKFMVANTLALAASVPIYLVQAMNSIDETWSVVVSRAEEAGKELARSLLVNNAGHRPVTLLGYSFGARVVFSCLKQLLVYQQEWEEYHEQKNSRAIGFAQQDEDGKSPSKREKKWMLEELEFDREPASVVEDVVVMGAPMYLSLSSWKACRQVVAGRFVNVYSRTDKILSLMFKYKQMMESFKPVCGNCTVAVPGVENIDISDLVSNHQEYVLKLGDILKRVRHGQPIRSSSNALDEVALIAEAQTFVKQQKKNAEAAKEDSSEPSNSATSKSR
ncbi:Transmembrane and coiled-coil domain-containing protein 4 [Seminavis robusta]|uniref:Transmembrane and coiled-coil domain-containing protein 4 n=1 Tax=Seminavis robusta TaxID=568900 RepID=A0A9N8E1C1_9STRA|nr:Transmembrane and coiled-coil domain-containing protein 4 [Seminavis robusta]|eukprot:Sro523_g159700.1 Transmembrane and coiled-coil domain-containing protein 4 (1249) ;mRNA; r:8865-12778